jgi:hypothetical protein
MLKGGSVETIITSGTFIHETAARLQRRIIQAVFKILAAEEF